MKHVVVKKDEVISDMKQRMSDILVSISWRDLARNYFGKSSSWFYHKMDGINGVGGNGGFTPDEAKQLQCALLDLSERIRKAAESIWTCLIEHPNNGEISCPGIVGVFIFEKKSHILFCY